MARRSRSDKHIGGPAFHGHWDAQTPMTNAERQSKVRKKSAAKTKGRATLTGAPATSRR